jgi:uncharacterized protein (TIRG00374 family)
MDWKRLIILLLVVTALIYVIYRIGINEILSVLPKALRPELLVFFVLYYFNVTLRGYRWKTLLDDSISLTEGFRLIFLTTFYNYISPVRLGELWRVNECKSSGLGRCSAAIVTEKVIDVGVILILVLVSLTFLGMGTESQIAQGIVGSVMMIVMAFVALQVLKHEKFWKIAGKFMKIKKGQHFHVREFLKERKMMLKVFVISLFIWLVDIFSFWYLANLIIPISIEISSIAYLISLLIGSSMITSVGVAQILVLIGVFSLTLSVVDAGAIGILFGVVAIWIQLPLGLIVDTWWKKR